MYADKGTTVNHCCEAAGSLVWSRSQTALTSLPSSQHNGCLSLSNVTRDSAGKYTCCPTNQFGFAEATTEVFFTGYLRVLFFQSDSEGNILAIMVPGTGWGGGGSRWFSVKVTGKIESRQRSKPKKILGKNKRGRKKVKKVHQIFSQNNPWCPLSKRNSFAGCNFGWSWFRLAHARGTMSNLQIYF